MKTTTLLIAAWLMSLSTMAQAIGEAAGRVGYMSGVLVAKRLDGTVKVISSKSTVYTGDMLITGKDSYAQLEMDDGTKMTLRPDSNLRIEAFRFRKETPQNDNMVLRLLKGGFRTLTGLIGKRGNADAYKLRAATATIGVRGTDFTARLCASKDCLDDEESGKPAKYQPVPVVAGRVMLAQGELSARQSGGKERKLLLGAPVYEGDTLITGAKSYMVVAFSDEGRVSLQENTQFLVEKFKYNKAKAEENAVLKLIKGGVRVITGLIGRANHDRYRFNMATATIGIRGTGFDAWCNGPCASGAANPGATQDNPLDGAGVYVWAGEVSLTSPGGMVLVPIQQAAIVARDTGKPARLINIPSAIFDNRVLRPDAIPLDKEKLPFDTESNAGGAGLYVTVHEGHVIMAMGEKSLNLFRGESGFANRGLLSPVISTPAFMQDPKMNPTGSGLPSGGMPGGDCKL
ncbi:MAG: FecR domain-containing protein [Nitrosomonadales bacterium]|nr:FecR domain-containing protein [Nitrosomonadales bacterium]